MAKMVLSWPVSLSYGVTNVMPEWRCSWPTPLDESVHPFAGCGGAVERFSGVARDVFQGGEHCLT